MSCGYIQPTYLPFYFVNPCGSCLMSLRSTAQKRSGHLSNVPTFRIGTGLTHRFSFWRSNNCLFSIMRELIRRNASKMTQKGSCPDLASYKAIIGFVYPVNCTKNNNALNNSTCLCKLQQKGWKNFSYGSMHIGTLKVHGSATGDICVVHIKQLPDIHIYTF